MLNLFSCVYLQRGNREDVTRWVSHELQDVVTRGKMSQDARVTTAVVEKPPQGPYTGPPPIGYPTRDVMLGDPPAAAVETKSKGDGFWKGCCAAICCCCVLDACF
ncbi:hypothetical protein Bca4012_090047 [Brassica carinata]